MSNDVLMQAQLNELQRGMRENIASIKNLHIALHTALSTIDDTNLSEDDQATLQDVKAKIGAFANAEGRAHIIAKPG